MDSVNKTLYIPLYGKAYVSKRGLILHDPKAEAIWEKEGFPLKGKAKSKWLAYNMGMRSAVFDRWTAEQAAALPDAAILHLGCGMDSRCVRLNCKNSWFDVDFPDVISERKRYYTETPGYHMISSDIREENWLEAIPGDDAIVVMEGVSMYLTDTERRDLLKSLSRRFHRGGFL